MPTTKKRIVTQISEVLRSAMDKKGVSIEQFADDMNVSYEYIRRIVNVDSIPTNAMLRMMAEYLDIDYKELATIAAQDRMRKKYGDLPLTALGVSEEVDSINTAWPHLTEEQIAFILTHIKEFLVENRKTPKTPPKGYTKPVAKKKSTKKG